MWYKNITGRFFGLVTKHAWDRRTDRRTDGQNYDSQDRTSTAASCGKKEINKKTRITWVDTLGLTRFVTRMLLSGWCDLKSQLLIVTCATASCYVWVSFARFSYAMLVSGTSF